MPVRLVGTATGTSNADKTSGQTYSFTPMNVSGASAVLLCVAVSAVNPPGPAAPSVSGLGLTWTLLDTVLFASVGTPTCGQALYLGLGHQVGTQIDVTINSDSTSAHVLAFGVTGIDLRRPVAHTFKAAQAGGVGVNLPLVVPLTSRSGSRAVFGCSGIVNITDTLTLPAGMTVIETTNTGPARKITAGFVDTFGLTSFNVVCSAATSAQGAVFALLNGDDEPRPARRGGHR